MHDIEQRQQWATDQLQQLGSVQRPAEVVDSLSAGLTLLRDLMFTRVHSDVEAHFGVDSMLAPATKSAQKRESHHTKLEIEIYSAVVAGNEVAISQYAGGDAQWFQNFLLHLRLGDKLPRSVQRRLQTYQQHSPTEGRFLFASTVERAAPEATKAPLVIYRLFPRAVQIAVALAFNDPLRAGEVRNEQTGLLPAIGDCHVCHGGLLENGESCAGCGNPLWQFSWLCVAD